MGLVYLLFLFALFPNDVSISCSYTLFFFSPQFLYPRLLFLLRRGCGWFLDHPTCSILIPYTSLRTSAGWIDHLPHLRYESLSRLYLLLSRITLLTALPRCCVPTSASHNLLYSCYRTLLLRPVGLHSLSMLLRRCAVSPLTTNSKCTYFYLPLNLTFRSLGVRGVHS